MSGISEYIPVFCSDYDGGFVSLLYFVPNGFNITGTLSPCRGLWGKCEPPNCSCWKTSQTSVVLRASGRRSFRSDHNLSWVIVRRWSVCFLMPFRNFLERFHVYHYDARSACRWIERLGLCKLWFLFPYNALVVFAARKAQAKAESANMD